MAKVPHVWEIPGFSGKLVTLSRLGSLPNPEDRWGWIWLAKSDSPEPLAQDPFGRLYVAADARLWMWGGGEKPSANGSPTDVVFVRWEYPSGGPDRVLALYVPSRSMSYFGTIREEPFGMYQVKRLIQKIADVPEGMRLK